MQIGSMYYTVIHLGSPGGEHQRAPARVGGGGLQVCWVAAAHKPVHVKSPGRVCKDKSGAGRVQNTSAPLRTERRDCEVSALTQQIHRAHECWLCWRCESTTFEQKEVAMSQIALRTLDAREICTTGPTRK